MSKILFISYSHDSEEHKAWVKKFADELETLGDFEILLDQNMPKGFPLTRFMEKGMTTADKVLVIGTPTYKTKAELGKGVAFEESIISTELLHDIETLKFYPILRSGSFETSFPIALQGRIGDDMSDDTKYHLTLQAIADSITNEKPVPAALRRFSHSVSVKDTKVANVYFTEDLLVETFYGRPNGNILGISFRVVVTNTSKEVRFFGKPSFKCSVPIEGDLDSFEMLNVITPMSFPAKLDYGEQFSISYKLVPNNIQMFAKMLQRDESATIKAIVWTTLNEKTESEPYPLSKIVQNSKYVR